MASIYSIVYRPVEYGDQREEYLRVPAERVNLIAGYGIEGDMKGGHHPERQLNLLSLEWLQALEPKGYKTGPGQFGEQIILSGLAVERLAPGTRLQLGRWACIEVVKGRMGCQRFEVAQGKTVLGLGALGVLAKVIESGPIAVGDPVSVLETVL